MKRIFQNKVVKWIVGAVVLIFVFLVGIGTGSSTAKTDIGKQKVTYGDLLGRVDSTKAELKKETDQVAGAKALIAKGDKAKKDLADTEAKLKDKQGELDKELADGRKAIDAKLADEQKTINAKIGDVNKQLSDTQAKFTEAQTKLSDVQGQVTAKQQQLDSLTGQIIKAKDAPKTLGSGQYVVGKDIPSGRYLAHALGRGSNFFVYDSTTGSAKVNTILGNADGLGSGDYTFFCSDGDTIETHEPVQLTPVQ